MIVRLLFFLGFAALADGQTWTPLTPAGSLPAARAWTSAVFDPASQRMIVFGGLGAAAVPLGDTWSLTTGSSPQWTQLSVTGTPPSARFGHAAAYDSRNARMIVFGGSTGQFGTCLNDTWLLNNPTGNGAWTTLPAAAASPAARQYHTAVYDPTSTRMIIFGGKDCSQNNAYFNDVWAVTTISTASGTLASWSPVQAVGTPPVAREGHTAVYDVNANRMIIFGGDAGGAPMNDVWQLDNANGVGGTPRWTQITPTSVAPVPRTFAVSVLDTVSNRLLINGGNNGSTELTDTFSLTGIANPFAPATWAQLPITGSTPSKSAASAVFDPGTNRVLVFAGNNGKNLLNDTWALNLGSGTLQPVTVTTTSLPNAIVGVVYTAQLAAGSGTPPYSNWAVAGGSLPPGLALNPNTGVISGTPTTSTGSPFAFTVTVKDSTGATSAPQALTLAVPTLAPVTIATATLPTATVSLPYSVQLTAAGGTPPYGNWVITSGALPPGITLNVATGVISGTPASTNGSPFTFTLTVRDNNSVLSAPQTLTLSIISGITISPATLPGGAVGVPYSQQLKAANGVEPFANWNVSTGALPPGLNLNNSSGLISGTPTFTPGGTFNFSVTVQDARGSTSAPQAYTIVIAGSVSITTTSLPSSSVSGLYSAQLTAIGGTQPYVTWSVVTGSLPGGLSLNSSTGLISGVPLAAGSFSFSVNVKDTAGATSGAQGLAIIIAPRVTISSTTLPGAAIGTSYAAQLTASDGLPPYSSWGLASGVLPVGLTLNSATGLISGTPATGSGVVTFDVTVKDSAGGTSVPKTISIAFGAPAVLTTAPASLTFNYRLGDPAPTPQSISVFTGGVFTVQARSDQNFLVTTPANGQSPATIAVSINTSSLRAGTFTGQVIVSLPTAVATSSTVQVTLNVEDPQGPQIRITPPRFSLTATQGGPPVRLPLAVLNPGGGTLNFAAQLRLIGGSNWASLDTSSGSSTSAAQAIVGLTVDPGALNPGVYRAEVTIQDQESDQSQICTILVAVNSQPASIQLSQAGLQFNAAAGGAASPPQTLAVANPGQGALNWTVGVQTLSGPEGWLNATPSTGSTAGGAAAPVTVSVSASNLAAGQYFGLVRIFSADAANSTQIVSVMVNVTDPAQAPAPSLSDAGALIVGNGTAPLLIANPSAKPLTYVATAATEDGANWVSFSPATGTLFTDRPTNIGVQTNLGGLATGVRRAILRLAFSDGSVRAYSVASVLPDAANCSPQGLVGTFLSPEPGFTASGTTPVSVRVAVADTCGAPLTSGMVSVRAGDGSNTIALAHAGNGLWSGTWVPSNTAGAVGLVATAVNSANPALVVQTPVLQGAIRASATALPRVTGVYDAASFRSGDQVALGSAVALLADGPAPADVFLLGDTTLPLLPRSAALNLLVPRSVVPNTQQQLVVQRGSSISVPLAVTVADVAPGIYATNQQGSGQGLVTIKGTTLMAAPAAAGARPAAHGETISILTSGLGDVENAPPAAVVTIGDARAQVSFTGLAPGVVGVFQVDAVVPADAPSGDAVTLLVSVSDIPSNPVTIAIQ